MHTPGAGVTEVEVTMATKSHMAEAGEEHGGHVTHSRRRPMVELYQCILQLCSLQLEYRYDANTALASLSNVYLCKL